jgi:hypothetical protein
MPDFEWGVAAIPVLTRDIPFSKRTIRLPFGSARHSSENLKFTLD